MHFFFKFGRTFLNDFDKNFRQVFDKFLVCENIESGRVCDGCFIFFMLFFFQYFFEIIALDGFLVYFNKKIIFKILFFSSSSTFLPTFERVFLSWV